MEKKYFKYSEASDKIRRAIVDRIAEFWDGEEDDYWRAGEIIEGWLAGGQISAADEIRKHFDDVEFYWDGDFHASFEGVCKDIPKLLRAAGATSAWASLRAGCRDFGLEMPAKWEDVNLKMVDGLDGYSAKATLGGEYDYAVKSELARIREFTMALSRRLAKEIRETNDDLVQEEIDERAASFAEERDGKILYQLGADGKILASGDDYEDFDYALALAEIEEQAILDFIPEATEPARRLSI